MFITKAIAQETEAAHGAAEAAHGAADAAAHGGGTFPPFDPTHFASQLFWLALSFGFFLWFMAKVIVPRIGGILENRQDRIAQDLAKARELRDEFTAVEAAYEQELAEARAKAHDIGQKARDKANAEAAAERAKVEEGLAAKLAEAENRIAAIRDKAMKEVGGIAESTAADIFAKVTGSTVTKADVAKALSAAGK